MAQDFEGLVSGAFAQLCVAWLPMAQKSALMIAFAGGYSNQTYEHIQRTYQGLELTPLGALLGAFNAVHRHQFVHPFFRDFAYSNHPIPIWHTQDIGQKAEEAMAAMENAYKAKGNLSQPELENRLMYFFSQEGANNGWINTSEPVLMLTMLALANLRPESSVLEVGSGCGYLLALASRIAQQGNVCGLEKNPALVKFSQEILSTFPNAQIFQGDALRGPPAEIPQNQGFDAIIFSAGTPSDVAGSFAVRLTDRGRLVAPIRCGTPSEIADGKCALAVYARTGAGCEVLTRKEPPLFFTPLTP